jgi:hypothetical protein
MVALGRQGEVAPQAETVSAASAAVTARSSRTTAARLVEDLAARR